MRELLGLDVVEAVARLELVESLEQEPVQLRPHLHEVAARRLDPGARLEQADLRGADTREVGRQRPVTVLPDDVATLVAQRDAARTARDWAESDRLRDAITASGYVVTDTPEGQQVRPAEGA